MNSVAHCGGFYLRDIVEEKCRLRPACRKLPGLSKEKTRITPRLSETSGAQQRKNTNFALLVGNFRDSAEKNTNYAPLVGNFRGSAEKNVNYRAFRNVGYNKCRDAHRGRMFRLLWTFVDLKLPSAMSHAIHKIVSIKRCQSYFISRRSPHLGISKDSESCASAHRCLHYARLIARVTFYLQLCGPLGQIPDLGSQAIVEFRLMADHENTSLVFFQCPFQLVFGIHIQMVRWLVQ